MKCPKCGGNKIFTCTDKLEYPNRKYFECIDCSYQSRKVEIYTFKCVNHKSKWEIELEALEREWE